MLANVIQVLFITLFGSTLNSSVKYVSHASPVMVESTIVFEFPARLILLQNDFGMLLSSSSSVLRLLSIRRRLITEKSFANSAANQSSCSSNGISVVSDILLISLCRNRCPTIRLSVSFSVSLVCLASFHALVDRFKDLFKLRSFLQDIWIINTEEIIEHCVPFYIDVYAFRQ